MDAVKNNQRATGDMEADRLAERLRWASSVLRQSVDINPAIRSGIPVLKGTRFTISQLFAELAEGRSTAEIAEDFGLDANVVREVLDGFSTHLDCPLSQ